MTPLRLAWTVLVVFLWTLGSCQAREQELVLYPKIDSSQTIKCDADCPSCNAVFWFRTVPSKNAVQYLGRSDNSDFATYGLDVDQSRFNFRKSGRFVLRIVNLTEEDAGIYSCVLKSKDSFTVWEPGVLLRPGVTPPTLPPETKPKPPGRPLCPCTKKKLSQDGCGSLVLWPLVGVLAGLAVALVCTLYYFSRLPKKCRHRFVNKR